jgi:hypothetical protein
VDDAAWNFVGRHVSPEDLTLIQSVVGEFAALSRAELASTVCELLGWTRATGRLKGRECRDLLERLEAAGLITLPAKRIGRPVGARTHVPVTARGDDQAAVAGTVGDLAPIVIKRVTTADERLLFRELVGRHHYLGHAVPFGAHLRYLVYASRPQPQVVACAQFSSAAWRMACRDACFSTTPGNAVIRPSPPASAPITTSPPIVFAKAESFFNVSSFVAISRLNSRRRFSTA